MTVEPALRAALLESLPGLRIFALSLVHNHDQADDLVQGTILKAWANFDQFERGSNLAAWLVTILRNLVRSEYRNKKREVEDPNGSYATQMCSLPEQQSHLDYEDMQVALTKLPFRSREALLLVAAEGLSYDEAAAVCHAPAGTIKSRVSRARAQLAKLLSLDNGEETGPDPITRAVLQSSS
jgi:RNA polymerase sigma-70 factor (ECF subfamily)